MSTSRYNLRSSFARRRAIAGRNNPKGLWSGQIYRTLFKRNSIWVTTIVAVTFLFETYSSRITDGLWSWINKGKLWPDVQKHIQALEAKKKEEDDESEE
eukprot:TRINITY_DN1415_c0_g1_i5.p1 TRINITY_DN1415_c0_g1~~TRINITY_DN1415_c0_g1_i5.p1  ORF type:complete len:109 (-),score=21.77 TRINITY_DN1415_c0_g1_i5:139-435(-)